MKTRKSPSVDSLREEIEILRVSLGDKVILLDDYYRQIVALNTALNRGGFKPLESLYRSEDCESPPSASLEELRGRVESVMQELERVRGELAKTQQGQREKDAVASELSNIIVEALRDRN
jgi:hypothetical protein